MRRGQAFIYHPGFLATPGRLAHSGATRGREWWWCQGGGVLLHGGRPWPVIPVPPRPQAPKRRRWSLLPIRGKRREKD
jgi:hypothetical protein